MIKIKIHHTKPNLFGSRWEISIQQGLLRLLYGRRHSLDDCLRLVEKYEGQRIKLEIN